MGKPSTTVNVYQNIIVRGFHTAAAFKCSSSKDSTTKTWAVIPSSAVPTLNPSPRMWSFVSVGDKSTADSFPLQAKFNMILYPTVV